MKMSARACARAWPPFAAVLFAFLTGISNATEVYANPMGKVVELLDVLSKQIEKEGKEDEKTYKEYTAYYQNSTKVSKAIIKENADKIARLTSELKEQEAFREGKNLDLVDLANKIAKNSAELSTGRAGRKKERAVFEKNEATFSESIDQLERALAVLKKKMPEKSSAASSASLLSIAEQLKTTLTQGPDFSLNTAQREILDSFMRSAQAPSFLQSSSHSRGPYGDYTSGSGGLIGTLQDLQVKVKAERDAALAEEQKAQKDFKDFQSGLTNMLENGKKSLADIRQSIAQSQEKSSQNQASLMEAKEIYKAEVEHAESVETEFRVKTQAYKIRLGKRNDEAIAVHEAQRILSSEAAKTYSKMGSIGTPDKSAANFIQQSQEKAAARRKALQLFKMAKSPGLALLALRTTVHIRSGSQADPFAKVTSMIKSMLSKLLAKEAQESKHHDWCVLETEKTTKDEKRKEGDIQKMKDRLAALSADLTSTKSDIATLNKDLKSMSEAMAAATIIREAERAQATKAIKQYKDGAALLTRACAVLKSYYESKESTEVKKNAFKQRKGMGTGIIGILEIAIEDFENLHDETKEAEDAARKDFKEMQQETRVRTAVFQKDLEWKSRTKVKLEFDQTTMKNDLKSYEKELEAIDGYMGKLKSSCIVQPPSYAEKKAKRDAELKSLREALDFLKD